MTVGAVLLRLGSALGLVVLNGFFVAVEFAVVAVRRTRIDQMVAEGNATARVFRRLLDSPDRVIAASQLGITIASLALGWIGEATVAALIEAPLESLLGGWSTAAAHTIGTGTAFALVTVLHIVLGEQVPKTIAIRYADRAALGVARPMRTFLRLFRPFISALDWMTSAVVRLLRMEPIAGHRAAYTLDELKLIVRESQEGGAIEPAQEQMLQKVFRFGDRQVREVMIPRTDVVGIEKGSDVAALVRLFSDASHSRFPVYEDDLDGVVGIVAIKDILRALAENPSQMQAPVEALARLPLFVPETLAVAELLARMRESRDQMAVVLDEYGGTAGIVTLEALVEEIVGEVSDELAVAEEPILRLDDRTVEVDAQLRVEDLNQTLGAALPEGEDYETVAGMLLYYFQRIPHERESLTLGGLVFQVTQMEGHKIARVQIRS